MGLPGSQHVGVCVGISLSLCLHLKGPVSAAGLGVGELICVWRSQQDPGVDAKVFRAPERQQLWDELGSSWGLHQNYPLVFRTPLSGRDSQQGSGKDPSTNGDGGQSHASALPCPSQPSSGICSSGRDTLPCHAHPQE